MNEEDRILSFGIEPENPFAIRFYKHMKSKIEKKLGKPKSRLTVIHNPHDGGEFIRKLMESDKSNQHGVTKNL